ncbi:MAG: radical SAM protein, partial [Gemmatimonadaceae bacterium]
MISPAAKSAVINRLPRHVYLHVPFCARRCSYCDFAIAVRRNVPVHDFVDSVQREIAIRFPESGAWPVDTIYLGGGTPSLLGADGLVRTLDALLERFSPALGAEITVEANPDDVSL